jgi:hypothetical protein
LASPAASAGTGAVGGAAAGSMFGPIGALVGAAGGAALSAYGSYEGGKAQQATYNYQAAVAAMNAKIANANAARAIQVGESQAQISGMQTRAQIGETKAVQSGSNLDVNKGSAVDVRASEADIGAENERTIRNDAQQKAYDFQVQAAQDTAQGNLDTFAGQNAMTAGKIGAFSSLLSGAGSVAGKWSQFSQQGAFGGGGGSASPAGYNPNLLSSLY